jgi:hypothetical protein
LLSIASCGDVISASCELDTWRSRHELSLGGRAPGPNG